MHHLTALTTLLILSALLSPSSCNTRRESNENARARSTARASPAAQEATPSDGVRRVTVDELRTALEKREAIIVDVRGEVEYSLGHIQGALLMPLGLIATRASELPRDKLIVTYCA